MNKKATKFSPEVRERAVRLVREQRSERPSMWAAVESIAPMIGCTPQTLLDWIKREEVWKEKVSHLNLIRQSRTIGTGNCQIGSRLLQSVAGATATTIR
ncbi:hypothetical protein [Burkholderia plantarii]|uniref:hypothetical protein n=1 Tax=Burkholderia plantarii TaxID=41899 RepID=UPI001F5B2946|nr:hypothetical protein [Burkholderia plantarii]